jgi:hypothetical protein
MLIAEEVGAGMAYGETWDGLRGNVARRRAA